MEPCQAGFTHAMYAHVLLTMGQMVLGAFAGYLAFKSREAERDREHKFRQVELQLELQTKELRKVVQDATGNNRSS